MGYRHSKEEMLEGAIAVAFADGLSRLTFGRVAAHLGISDRVLVYYFPTKDDLIGEVLLALGARLQETLDADASPPPDDHRALVRNVWPTLARVETDPIFALYFEAAGLASAGREPYRSFVPQLVDAWISWAVDRLAGPTATRRNEAAAAIATIDGLLILRQLAGPDVAERAARRMGVAPRTR